MLVQPPNGGGLRFQIPGVEEIGQRGLEVCSGNRAITPGEQTANRLARNTWPQSQLRVSQRVAQRLTS